MQIDESYRAGSAQQVAAGDTTTGHGRLQIAVAGDIMTHGSQIASAYDPACQCYDFVPAFDPVCPVFTGADLAIANLETTLPGKNYSGYPQFGAPDALIDAIRHCGIGVLTTANNHCVDKKKHGLVRTLDVLDEKGVGHLGTYRSHEEFEQNRIFVYEQNGIRVALLNYTYGTNMIPTPRGTMVNRIDKKQIAEDIAAARAQNVDFVAVLYHFGQEYLNRPDAFQREMVDFAVQEGADLIIGGHPHHVQPYGLVELDDRHGERKPRLIAYSLGNFVSAQRNRYTDGGMVLKFTLTKTTGDSGETERAITDVRHEFVWVHAEKRGELVDYRILPTAVYLAGAGEIELPASALKRMRRFVDDAERVLRDPKGFPAGQPVPKPARRAGSAKKG